MTLPLALPGIIAGMMLAFARALGEFGATITFVSNIPGETQTISAAIYTLTQVPGGDARRAVAGHRRRDHFARRAGRVGMVRPPRRARASTGLEHAGRSTSKKRSAISRSARSFAGEAGVTALFGPSGAGKTTIVNMIAGLLKPDRGRIVLDDDVLFDSAARIDVPVWRRRIGYVFQEGRLFPHL